MVEAKLMEWVWRGGAKPGNGDVACLAFKIPHGKLICCLSMTQNPFHIPLIINVLLPAYRYNTRQQT